MVLDMALSRIVIGDYVKLVSQPCGIANLTINDVSGINRDKEFFEPSKQVSSDTSNYKVVPVDCFACNLMHIGRDVVLPVALNTSGKDKIVSPAYTVFKVKDETVIMKEFLFLLLKSSEKDRYFWFHCDSSVRDGMDWNSFCEIELEIPPIEIQRKYVAVYESMLANLHSYEKGLDDLKLVCDGFIEYLRKKHRLQFIGDFIEDTSTKNSNINLKIVGISNTQKLIESNSRTMGVDKTHYLLLKHGQFAYSPIHINDGSIAFNDEENVIVSPIYRTFRVINENVLNPRYLMLWFSRREFIRYCYFCAFGSARDSFEWKQMREVSIPIPEIGVQNDIVRIFDILNFRKKEVIELKRLTSDICPLLIRGATAEAERGEQHA